MSAYSDSVFEPVFSEPDPVSTKKYRNENRNRVFPSVSVRFHRYPTVRLQKKREQSRPHPVINYLPFHKDYLPSVKNIVSPQPPTDPTTPPSLFPSPLDPCLACDRGGPRPGPPLPLPLPPALDNHNLSLRREVARIPRPLHHAQVSATAVATSQTVVDEAGRHDATLQTPPDKNGAASLWVLADVVLGFDSLDPYLEGHCLQPLSAEG